MDGAATANIGLILGNVTDLDLVDTGICEQSQLGCDVVDHTDNEYLRGEAAVAGFDRLRSHPLGLGTITGYMDVATHDDWAWIPLMHSAGGAVAVGERHRLLDRSLGAAHPTGGHSSRPVERFRSMAGQPDLDRRIRQRRDACLMDGERLTGRHLLAGEQPPHDVEAGLEPRDAVSQPDAHGGELLIATAECDLKDEPPAGDRGQGRNLLGEDHRVPQRKQIQRARRPRPLGEEAAELRRVLVVPGRL